MPTTTTRRPMSWGRVAKSVQALAAHGLLFSFTILLLFKLQRHVFHSWWVVFFPLWLFHVVIARGRFSLPAPSLPYNRHWAPCHAVVATPLLVAFELLLCIYMESIYVHGSAVVNLKIVFLPLFAFQIIILTDNFRMCKALMPGDNENLSNEVIREALPHLWVAISMVFFIAATLFTLLKLCGSVYLSWWGLFIIFGVAQCFTFLICTRWSNPVIHSNSCPGEASSSSTAIQYLDWSSGLVVSIEDAQHQDRMCGLQDIGGHIIKIPVIGFQILLCMRLEGTPMGAKNIPLPVLFSPLFVLQGAGILLASSRMVEKLVLLLCSGTPTGRYFTLSSKASDCFMFLHHGSRLLGWWSIDDGSREEQAPLFRADFSGYNTFCGYPPEIVKKMPKKDLAEEVWRLQAALGEQTEVAKYSQQEYDRLQNEKVLCRLCFKADINVVLLPCRHRILCSTCCVKCQKCPICRVCVEECLPVYDV